MQPSHKHSPKGNPVATALTCSEVRWKLTAPCFIPVQISSQNYLVTGGQLDTGEHSMESPVVIFFQVNQQQDKMILPACTNFPIPRSFSGKKSTRQTGNRNKGSKSLKDCSNQSSDNCILPNKPPQSDSTLDSSDTLFDIPTKSSETVKRHPKRKGKKKGRYCKKPSHSGDHVADKAVCEMKLIDFSASKAAEHLIVSNNANNAQLLQTHSDSMDESEPPGSSFEESACGSSICDQPSPTENSSHPTSFSSETKTHENMNVSSVSGSQDLNVLEFSECQVISKSFDKSATQGISVPDWCDRAIDDGENLECWQKNFNCMASSSDRSGCLDGKESGDIGGFCQLSMQKKRRKGRESCGNSSSFRKVTGHNPHSKMRRHTVHPIWQKVENKVEEECTKRGQVPYLAPDADVLQELEVECENDAANPSKHSVGCLPDTVCASNRVDCNSKFENVTQMFDREMNIPASVLKGSDSQSSRECNGNGKTRTFIPIKVPLQEHNAVNRSTGSEEKLSLKSFAKNSHQKKFQSSPYRANTFPLKSEKGSCAQITRTVLHGDPQCFNKGENSEAVCRQTEPALTILNSLEQKKSIPGLGFEKTNGVSYKTEMHHFHDFACSTESDMISVTAASPLENCNIEAPASPKQKWVPVGKKDPPVVSYSYGFVHGNQYPNSIGENATQKSKMFSVERSPKNLPSDLIDTAILVSGKRNGACSAISAGPSLKSNVSFDSDLEKITQAVSDAHGLEAASEFLHLQTGDPLADFEKVLHSASPAICQISSLSSCRSCSHDGKTSNSLCRDHIPNISLRNLWRWYEKHGSYGLEVKVEDQKSRKLGTCSNFRAYFVPYLSAVQLFGQAKSSLSAENSNPGDSLLETERLLETESGLTTSPILSILLPRPCQEIPAEIVEHSSSHDGVGKCNSPSYCPKNNERLLFEYFESDPPQQRPPLFEKIKMLVRGDRSLNSRTFGDPKNLECLHLHDIDPASWFSVAWYPIYRIPDGSLRAAFLTYHCLGSFTQRISEAKHGHVTDVVSPVVGLESYNARAECWFQLGDRNSNLAKSETPLMNPSRILEERLRTLNQTATAMARASIQRHGQKSANRQPDYEFFVSRAY